MTRGSALGGSVIAFVIMMLINTSIIKILTAVVFILIGLIFNLIT